MNNDAFNEESYYVMKEIDSRGIQSQRELSKNMGCSLGKINFILKALTRKGLIKLDRFIQSNNKVGYRYVLTPNGIKERVRITKAFLKRKETQYLRIQAEIEEARRIIENEYV